MVSRLGLLSRDDIESIMHSFERFIQDKPSIEGDTLLFRNRIVSIRGCSINRNGALVHKDKALLSRFEQHKLEQFKTLDRADQYYVGRVLAKRCWIDLEAENSNEYQHNNLSIEANSDGCPCFVLDVGIRKHSVFPSITHKHELVLVAASKTSRLGIDLESILQKHSSPIRWMSSNPDEEILNLVRAVLFSEGFHAEEVEVTNVLWSALEAGFKALCGRDVSSPLDLSLSAKNGIIRIASKIIDESMFKKVDLFLSRPYLLSLAS